MAGRSGPEESVKQLSLSIVAAFALAAPAAAQTPAAPDAQIAAAVQAAPEDKRAGATVLGYDAAGALTTLRKGTNELICLADNPKVDGIGVACYHQDLEPFMARGRELTAQGVTDDKVRDQTRFKEVDAGKLRMPKEPRMLYVTSGKAVDAATGQIVEASTRWVIYVPYATAETTGMPTKPGPGAPWLMDPGTPGAHVMISPARPR
jgi:hypothetical protein